jgi:hypothetical protein
MATEMVEHQTTAEEAKHPLSYLWNLPHHSRTDNNINNVQNNNSYSQDTNRILLARHNSGLITNEIKVDKNMFSSH